MRKLPVFLVIDVSESVAGPLQQSITEGMKAIVTGLRSDPQALESVQLSVIVFAGKAKVLVNMIELINFYPPSLPIGGGTSINAALETLMVEIDTHVVKGSKTKKSDWKPMVFLITDGVPTDNRTDAIEKWKSEYAHKATLVSVSIGGGADHSLLRELSENIVVLANSSADTLVKFFQWISQSVAVHSNALADRKPGTGVDLSKNLPEGAVSLTKVEPPSVDVDERLAVFVAKCQHNEAPYLMRFERVGPAGDLSRYALRQTIPLTQEYFELSDSTASPSTTISASRLQGHAGCPHCGTSIAMAECSCGKMHCIDGPGQATCPWCGVSQNFVQAQEGTTIDFSRGAG